MPLPHSLRHPPYAFWLVSVLVLAAGTFALSSGVISSGPIGVSPSSALSTSPAEARGEVLMFRADVFALGRMLVPYDAGIHTEAGLLAGRLTAAAEGRPAAQQEALYGLADALEALEASGTPGRLAGVPGDVPSQDGGGVPAPDAVQDAYGQVLAAADLLAASVWR